MTTSQPPTPPSTPADEQKYGWVVVASSHVVFALWAGLLKTIGVLLPSLTEYYETDVLVLGWITAGVSSTNNIAAVLGSVLSSVLGGRLTVILGGTMAASGLFLASISSRLLPFALALTLLTGTGTGVVMCVFKVYLGLHFKDRLPLASGIAVMGVPVGLIVFPGLAEFLCSTYDIQGTLLIFGALMTHLIVCGLLLRPPKGVTINGATNGYTPIDSSSNQQPSLDAVLLNQLAELLDISLLKKLDMWALMTMFTMFSFVNDSWLTFMVSNAMSKGFDGFISVSFSIIAGVSAVIFSLVQGIVISKNPSSVRLVASAATTVGSLALLLNPFFESFATMVIAVAMYGVALGVISPTIVSLVIETQGRNRSASAFGWIGIASGLFRMAFGFSTGGLHDITGNYDATFILLGAMLAVILPMLFVAQTNERNSN